MLTTQRLPKDFQLFITVVVFAAGAIIWVFGAEIRWQEWPELLMFMMLITVTSTFPIPHPRGGYVSSTTTLMYVLLSVQEPVSALLVAGCGYAIGHATARGLVPWRTFYNGAQRGSSVGLASLTIRVECGAHHTETVLLFLIHFPIACLVTQ